MDPNHARYQLRYTRMELGPKYFKPNSQLLIIITFSYSVKHYFPRSAGTEISRPGGPVPMRL